MTERLLSAVVVCYRDAPAILQMHARLVEVFRALSVEYEIVFVNDCSPDDADAVLRDLTARDARVIAIEHSRNFGSQNAFLSGMQLTTGDAVILLDGDLQDPPELIADFYAKWRDGYEVVYGMRQKREGSTLLAALCRCFYRLFRTVSYVSMPLDAGDFALMDRKVVRELLALPETDQFLRGLRAWVGFKQTGVPYVRPQRAFGRSTHSWLANVWWAKKGIFSFTFLPVELLGYGATVLVVLSVLVGGQQIFEALRHPAASHTLSLTLVAIAFFGSVNLLAIATIGEYLIKIFEETKRRPKFIRKSIRQGARLFGAGAELDDFCGRERDNVSARLTAMKPERVLITGTTAGLGRGLLQRYFERGDRVIAVNRRRVPELECQYPGVRFECVDVRSASAVTRLMSALAESGELPNVLILNAGINRIDNDESFQVSSYRDVIDTNLFGVLNFVEALTLLPASEAARHVVAISSMASYVGNPYGLGYFTSKRALSACFDVWSRMYADTDLIFQQVMLGPVSTAMYTMAGSFPAWMVWLRNAFSASLESTVTAVCQLASGRRRRLYHPRRVTLLYLGMRACQALVPGFFRGRKTLAGGARRRCSP